MLVDEVIQRGMYNVLQDWYNFIDAQYSIKADLIGGYKDRVITETDMDVFQACSL